MIITLMYKTGPGCPNVTEQSKILYSGNQLWRLWKSQLKKISSRNSSKSDVSWLKALAKAKKHDSDLLDQQTVLSEAKVKREKS